MSGCENATNEQSGGEGEMSRRRRGEGAEEEDEAGLPPLPPLAATEPDSGDEHDEHDDASFYALLNVPHSASQAEITAAYRQIAG